MGQLSSIDNVQWVQDNKDILKADDIQATFMIVYKMHPKGGMAYDALTLERIRDRLKEESIEDIAKYADAVTVCCCEVLGVDNELPQGDRQSLNTTALGNAAYIALHHSRADVREKYAAFVDKYK